MLKKCASCIGGQMRFRFSQGQVRYTTMTLEPNGPSIYFTCVPKILTAGIFPFASGSCFFLMRCHHLLFQLLCYIYNNTILSLLIYYNGDQFYAVSRRFSKTF